MNLGNQNMSKKIQIIFTIIGIVIFGVLVYSSDPQKIFEKLQSISYYIIPILLAYIPVILLDTLGWKYVLISKEKKYNFWTLLKVKLAGDFVKRIAPGGSIAGEPVKAYILKRYDVPFVEGMASVYMNKLLMAKGQVLFILMGLIFSFFYLILEDPLMLYIGLGFIIVVASGLGFVYFLGLKKGLFNVLITLLEKVRINFSFVVKQRENLNLFDEKVSSFYKNHKKEFGLSLLSFFAGWLFSALEIFVILNILGIPISFSQAIIIESINSIIGVIFFFIPANIGTQETGFIFLFKLVLGSLFLNPAQAETFAITYSVIRRIRELLWVGIGMVFLTGFNLSISKIKDKQKNPIETSSIPHPVN